MLNRISVRRDSEVARQAGKAAFAAATAAATSSADAKSTSLAVRPVAGSNTGPVRPEVPGTRAPPIQWLTRGRRVVGDEVGSASCVMAGSSGVPWWAIRIPTTGLAGSP